MLASDRPAPSARPRDIDYIRVAEPAPVVLAYGIGVDSTALLVELESRGTPPDLVITGDPGSEKPETYVYQAQLEQCFWKRHFCSMTCTHRRECYHYIFGFG